MGTDLYRLFSTIADENYPDRHAPTERHVDYARLNARAHQSERSAEWWESVKRLPLKERLAPFFRKLTEGP